MIMYIMTGIVLLLAVGGLLGFGYWAWGWVKR